MPWPANRPDDLVDDPLPAWAHRSLPTAADGLRPSALHTLGLNLREGALPLPAAVLSRPAIDHNRRWLRAFMALNGCLLAPHGKTTMAPQLWREQLDDGAWAITLATAAQLRVARRFGVPRVLLANQLVGEGNVALVLDELRADPNFEALVLVDSLPGLQTLVTALQAHPIGRPLPVLLEVGAAGGRCGVRSLAEGEALARASAAAAPWVALRGVECFEDLFGRDDAPRVELSVLALLDTVAALARQGLAEGWFAPGPVLLSAGGSSFFDLAAAVLGAVRDACPERELQVVLRSGCTITHDSWHYLRQAERMRERGRVVWPAGEGLRPALTVWAVVQSLPEPGRAIVGFGKRDASFDMDLPRPLQWWRSGVHAAPQPAPDGLAVVKLNDQHAFVDGPGTSALAVGDRLVFGISHPCTTFDRWPLLLEVDADDRVIGAVRTFF